MVVSEENGGGVERRYLMAWRDGMEYPGVRKPLSGLEIRVDRLLQWLVRGSRVEMTSRSLVLGDDCGR